MYRTLEWRWHNEKTQSFYLSLMMIALVAIVTVFTVAADDSDADASLLTV